MRCCLNYIYDYKTDLDLSQVYTGEVTAKFKNPTQLNITGLPEDAQNLKAKVYYTTGGRNAEYTYITPLIVDPKDDDIDPVFVELDGSKLSIEAGSITNNAGTTESFGSLVDGTTYTVELSADNYILRKVSVVYNAAEDDYTEDEPVSPPEESSSTPEESSSTSEESSSTAEESSSTAEETSSTAEETSSTAGDKSSSNAQPTNQSSGDNPKTGVQATAAAFGAVLVCATVLVKKKRK